MVSMLTEAQAWQVLQQVPDPEIPAVSVCDLGIVRDVQAQPRETVAITTTPAVPPPKSSRRRSVRRSAGRRAIGACGDTALAPWTRLGFPGGRKAERLGHCTAPLTPAAALRCCASCLLRPACPRWSRDSERLSEFGATACKALYRCRACLEPFEYFKPI